MNGNSKMEKGKNTLRIGIIGARKSIWWLTSLEKYHNKMLEYAPKAFDLARPVIWQIRLANPVLRWIALNIGLLVVDIALRFRNQKR